MNGSISAHIIPIVISVPKEAPHGNSLEIFNSLDLLKASVSRFYLESFGGGLEVGEKSTFLVQLFDYSLVLLPQFLPDQVVVKILFFWL